MSRKKGQLLSEISQNLKQTIKKYNELTMDDNFFNDEFKSKSTNNYNNRQPQSQISNVSTNINNNQNPTNINNDEKNNNFNSNNNDGLSLLKINEMDEEINNIEQHQNNFVSQLNTLMNNLNILEDNINKDFDELENYIENDIEKELISK